MKKRSAVVGFTLVELLVVLTVLVILQSLAVPSFVGTINSMRLTTAANALFSSLLLARSEAIKRDARVVVCKSGDGVVCATSGGWEQGWMVFHDANNNAARDVGEVLLLRQQALPPTVRLTGNGLVESYVSYTSAGSTRYTSGAFQAGTFTACTLLQTGGDARQIVLNMTGRPRLATSKLEQCSGT